LKTRGLRNVEKVGGHKFSLILVAFLSGTFKDSEWNNVKFSNSTLHNSTISFLETESVEFSNGKINNVRFNSIASSLSDFCICNSSLIDIGFYKDFSGSLKECDIKQLALAVSDSSIAVNKCKVLDSFFIQSNNLLTFDSCEITDGIFSGVLYSEKDKESRFLEEILSNWSSVVFEEGVRATWRKLKFKKCTFFWWDFIKIDIEQCVFQQCLFVACRFPTKWIIDDSFKEIATRCSFNTILVKSSEDSSIFNDISYKTVAVIEAISKKYSSFQKRSNILKNVEIFKDLKKAAKNTHINIESLSSIFNYAKEKDFLISRLE